MTASSSSGAHAILTVGVPIVVAAGVAYALFAPETRPGVSEGAWYAPGNIVMLAVIALLWVGVGLIVRSLKGTYVEALIAVPVSILVAGGVTITRAIRGDYLLGMGGNEILREALQGGLAGAVAAIFVVSLLSRKQRKTMGAREAKGRFVALRAQNRRLVDIEEELGVELCTLVVWETELANEVASRKRSQATEGPGSKRDDSG